MGFVRMVYSQRSFSMSFSALRRDSRSADESADGLAAAMVAGINMATTSRQIIIRIEAPERIWLTLRIEHTNILCSVRRIRRQMVIGSRKLICWHWPGHGADRQQHLAARR